MSTARQVSLLSRKPLTRNQRYRKTAKGKAMIARANARARGKRTAAQLERDRAMKAAWESANAVQRRVYKRTWAFEKYHRAKRIAESAAQG